MVFNHDYPRKGYNTGDSIGYLTFNALRDNKDLGDERYNFVKVKKQRDDKFVKAIKVDLGDKFTVRIYFHNNMDPSLAGKENGYSYDTKIGYTSGVFTCFEDNWESYNSMNSQGFMGYVTSSNSDPKTVQDFCVVVFLECAHYEYIKGSSTITTKNGTRSFPDYGGLIGIDQLDGVIPPGEFGYVEMNYEVIAG